MKKILRLLWLILLCFTVSSTAGNDKIKKDLVKESYEKHFPNRYDSHRLRSYKEKLRNYLREHPEAYQPNRLLKKTAWNFQVGESHTWWAHNIETDTDYQTETTCRAVGKYCYIFVEDSQWEQSGNGRVTQTAVDGLQNAFDNETPIFPNKGIYKVGVETFGNPPNVDSDSKIIILILDIQDGYSGSGGYTAGYFNSGNEFQGGTSNESEMVYIDSDPSDFSNAEGIETQCSFLAHEFQHMIHFNYDYDEATFINEGCSMLAEHVCGYTIPYQFYFTDEPNQSLLNWQEEFKDYMRAYRWSLYLFEQFPNDYIKKLVAHTAIGTSGVDGSLASYTPATNRRFNDIFKDWCVANYVMDTSVDPRYGYTAPPATKVTAAQIHVDPNVALTQSDVQYLAAEYITFIGGSDLTVKFSSPSSSLVVKAIKTGSTVVEDVPLNTDYSVPDFGTTYSEVTFALINKDKNSPASYSYSASGTSSSTPISLIYDDGEPDGFLPLDEGDTMTVIFEGLQGTYLDYLDIAFHRAGTIKMGINIIDYEHPTSFIGTPLLQPINVQCTTESEPYPYPIPYENWVTVDFSANQIDTGTDFIVWFLVGSDYSKPGLMISIEPDIGTRRWLTFSTADNKWTNYGPVDQEDHIFKYMVHAYLRPNTGIQDQEKGIPLHFELVQNYPNPFNPKTTILYALPSPQHAVLKVYDAIGHEVDILVDNQKSAGNHSVVFDGTGLPSGVYMIRLSAGEFCQTHKMILMK